MPLAQSIVAILFFRGEPVLLVDLAAHLQVDEAAIRSAAEEVRALLTQVGLSLVETPEALELRTSSSAADLIEQIRKEELSKDLGKAALETLSILMYRGPSTRAEVDYIRGVNSTAILRNLMIRGLVEKDQNPNDQRSFLYKPTHELLAHLGIQSLAELPAYANIQQELAAFQQGVTDTETP